MIASYQATALKLGDGFIFMNSEMGCWNGAVQNVVHGMIAMPIEYTFVALFLWAMLLNAHAGEHSLVLITVNLSSL
jgi:hypothetical protein